MLGRGLISKSMSKETQIHARSDRPLRNLLDAVDRMIRAAADADSAREALLRAVSAPELRVVRECEGEGGQHGPPH
jgi:hypothetical protein